MTNEHNSNSANEELFLQNLFSADEQQLEVEENETTAAAVSEIPDALSKRLLAIAESGTDGPLALGRNTPRRHFFISVQQLFKFSWQSWAGVTAAALVAVLLIQVAQQRTSISELENAQRDLKVALQYLHEANRTAETRVLEALSDQMQKATVTPVIESMHPIAVHGNEPLGRTEL